MAEFKHHMLREIFEQPAAVLQTFEAAQMNSASCSLYQRSWEQAKLQQLSRIVIAASGTSRHAGIAGEFMIESLAGIPVDVDYASEFQFSPDKISRETLTIVITQSGETADTLAALRKAKKAGSTVAEIAVVDLKKCLVNLPASLFVLLSNIATVMDPFCSHCDASHLLGIDC